MRDNQQTGRPDFSRAVTSPARLKSGLPQGIPAMQGPTIYAKARPPWGGFLFLILSGCLLVAAVVEKTPHIAIFAILPFLGGLALIWRRPQAFSAQLTADAIEVTEPTRIVIPYESLDGLRGPSTADLSR